MPRVVVVAVLCAALVHPASAAGSALTIAVGPDPVSEKQIAVTASGAVDRDAVLDVDVEPAARPCLPDRASLMWGRRVAGPFTVTETVLFDEPGSYVLCGTLRSWDDSTELARSVTPVAARAPHVELHIEAPRTLPRGAHFRVGVTGIAEVERSLTGELVPSDDVCDPDEGVLNQRLGLWDVTGPFNVRSGFRVDRYGTWKMCAYLRRYLLRAPAFVASAPIRVTVRCTRASRALGRARDRWRGLNRRLALSGRPANRESRRRGTVVRRARRAAARACPR